MENKKKIIIKDYIHIPKRITEVKKPKVVRGKAIKKEPEMPIEEENKPKTDEIPKIEIVVLDHPQLFEIAEIPTTSKTRRRRS